MAHKSPFLHHTAKLSRTPVDVPAPRDSSPSSSERRPVGCRPLPAGQELQVEGVLLGAAASCFLAACFPTAKLAAAALLVHDLQTGCTAVCCHTHATCSTTACQQGEQESSVFQACGVHADSPGALQHSTAGQSAAVSSAAPVEQSACEAPPQPASATTTFASIVQEAAKSQITCGFNILKSAMQGLHLRIWRHPLQRLVEAGGIVCKPATGGSK